jgi:hypothetical protein
MMHVRFSPAIVGRSTCHIVYFPASNTLNLINDAETGLVSRNGVIPGTASLSNNNCTVAASAARSLAGNSLTLTLPVMFNGGTFGGPKSIYVNVFDDVGALSHWVQTGQWTVQ